MLFSLLAIGIDCVVQFSLDYMHLVCFGLEHRLLNFITNAPVDRLSQRQKALILERLTNFSGRLSSEFARQPRSVFG